MNLIILIYFILISYIISCEINQYWGYKYQSKYNNQPECLKCPASTYNIYYGQIGIESCIVCPNDISDMISNDPIKLACDPDIKINTINELIFKVFELSGNNAHNAHSALSVLNYDVNYRYSSIKYNCHVGEAGSVLFDKYMCVQCLPGTFSHGASVNNCNLCPVGTYQSEYRSDICQICPEGTSHLGANSLEGCQSKRKRLPVINSLPKGGSLIQEENKSRPLIRQIKRLCIMFLIYCLFIFQHQLILYQIIKVLRHFIFSNLK